ncbi:hypothetical protein GJ744_000745 [Endocarpon pusillum]|uniref:Uncharacterized protein n=1 Tax=Endocarpon pusillum TaxID=364733 RepID=A0A8H7E2B1_9EURO|nr:hypothetical protein GJ744_000745 [Endocarpon pusillum]
MPPVPEMTPEKARRRLKDAISDGRNVRQDDLDLVRDQPEVHAKAIKHMKGRGVVMKTSKNYGISLNEAERNLNDPQGDPWAAIERDVTLPFLITQVFRIYDS